MANVKTKQKERLLYPGVERAYKRAIARLITKHGQYSQLDYNVDDIFDWWVSNKSIKEYLADKQLNRLDL